MNSKTFVMQMSDLSDDAFVARDLGRKHSAPFIEIHQGTRGHRFLQKIKLFSRDKAYGIFKTNHPRVFSDWIKGEGSTRRWAGGELVAKLEYLNPGGSVKGHPRADPSSHARFPSTTPSDKDHACNSYGPEYWAEKESVMIRC